MKKMILILIGFVLLPLMSCKKENVEPTPEPISTVKTYDLTQYKTFEYGMDGYKYVLVKENYFEEIVIGQSMVILLSNSTTSEFVEKTIYCIDKTKTSRVDNNFQMDHYKSFYDVITLTEIKYRSANYESTYILRDIDLNLGYWSL